MKKLKGLIKHTLLLFADFLIKKNEYIENNTLLLIRLDAIGDYVLFRNFIEIVKKSPKYNNYKITLAGNIVWKSIAEELDSGYIDKFIWIDRRKFENNLIYRYKKLKEIASSGYDVVINPIYSRSFFCDDSIVKVVNAKEKIGNYGDLSNIKKWQKAISDKYYTRLFPASSGIIFEFYRHKEFFTHLLEENVNIQKPTIQLKPKKIGFNLPDRYAILFIGASASFRKWSIKNFVEIGSYLKDKYGYEIVLCGGPSDLDEANEFSKFADYTYVDLVGKTSLVDFMYVVYNGNLMIANETSAPHFAVALEMTNIFVVYNGNHFGRFTPYPKDIWHGYHTVYHPEIERSLDEYIKLSNRYGYGSKLDINDIKVEKVIRQIKKHLKLQNSKKTGKKNTILGNKVLHG